MVGGINFWVHTVTYIPRDKLKLEALRQRVIVFLQGWLDPFPPSSPPHSTYVWREEACAVLIVYLYM